MKKNFNVFENLFEVGDILIENKGDLAVYVGCTFVDNMGSVFYEVVEVTDTEILTRKLKQKYTVLFRAEDYATVMHTIPCPGEYQSEETFRLNIHVNEYNHYWYDIDECVA